MRIERNDYTEDKKRWEEAEAQANAHYDSMTAEEIQAEMQFFTQAFSGLWTECEKKFARIKEVPNPEKAEHFATLQNQALYAAEYFHANLLPENNALRGIIRFELDRILIQGMMNQLVLSTLGTLIAEASSGWIESANNLIVMRLTNHLFDEVSV